MYTYFTLFNVYNSPNICTHIYVHTYIYMSRSLARSPLASSQYIAQINHYPQYIVYTHT
nr:MAG TPA: hypothetical protein [Caudoviricetes sp.]